jgi:serine protease Do
MARGVMDQIIKHGHVVRGWLGVTIQEVTPEIAKAFGLKEQRGALVGDVAPDSPAAKAGLQRGDVILAMNGAPVEDVRSLQLKIASMQPGTTARFQVSRNGQTHEITATLGELPAEQQQAGPSRGGREQGGEARLGIAVQELTPEILKQLELPPNTRGVLVADVAAGSPAAMAGLQRGDVIQQVNRKPVANVAEFASLVRQARGQPVLLLVNSQGATHFVVVEPAPEPAQR